MLFLTVGGQRRHKLPSLIDNVAFFRGEDGIEVDRGVVLERWSVLEEN